jgi:AcrR family transcriptional regulator
MEPMPLTDPGPSPAQASPKARPTSEQLILAAEELFSEHGIEGASLRQISQRAGQRNTGAIQYHFGSKDELLRAIVEYRRPAVNARRAVLLDLIEHRGLVEDLPSLAEAFVLPPAAQLDEPDNHYLGLLARLTSHTATDHPVVVIEGGSLDAMARLQKLVGRRLRDLPRVIVEQRFSLATTTVTHALADRQQALRSGRVDAAETPLFVAGLIDAVVGVLGGPVSSASLSLVPEQRIQENP